MPKPSINLSKNSEPEEMGAYFTSNNKGTLTFIKSGCTLLDLSLGGGWPLGKISNVCGDFSTGKSLLAIEAMTNFHIQFPDSPMFYLEAEAGFDVEYAEAMGLPPGAVTFISEDDIGDYTIEAWYDHISDVLEDKDLKDTPIYYCLDSLDAMSDKAELARDISDGSYAMNKQKKLGELFRRLTKKVEASKMQLQIVSQLRENIGVSFGKKHRRSGGKALDFYASQVIWLARKKQITKEKKKVKRVIGVEIATNCEKNKVGMPFRKSEFKILFGFGIDDTQSMLDWLKEIGRLEDFIDPITNAPIKTVDAYLRRYRAHNREERASINAALEEIVTTIWYEIEESFLPTFSKY